MPGLPMVKDMAIAQNMALGYRLSASLTVVACSSLLALATAAVMAADSAAVGIVVSMLVRNSVRVSCRRENKLLLEIISSSGEK